MAFQTQKVKFLIIIDKEPKSVFGITVPDIPGCFGAAINFEDIEESASEAVLAHTQYLCDSNGEHTIEITPTTIFALEKSENFKEVLEDGIGKNRFIAEVEVLVDARINIVPQGGINEHTG